ncbi:uncharacterized protein LOC121376482 [Gigantopelta aegis]|uniref:uncharacterized protein LOC121376482 n=1 Tax=Gigantopelta aegis TaxID=1735272 RepID=UPI001B887C93|nr:uncharacterized protein LOC121376482 [Gigantopelta aegis]
MYDVFLETLYDNRYRPLRKQLKDTHVDEDFNLEPGDYRVICGKVITNEEIVSAEGKPYRCVKLLHRQLGQIEATAHNPAAIKTAEYLETGNFYTIRDVRLQKIPEKFNTPDEANIQIIINNSSHFTLNENPSENIKNLKIKYITIEEIQRRKDSCYVNLHARIIDLGEPFRTSRKNILCRKIDLSDNSHQIQIALFEENTNKYNKGQNLTIIGAKVNSSNDTVSLTTSLKTVIYVSDSLSDSDDKIVQATIREIRNKYRIPDSCQKQNCGSRLNKLPNGKYVCTICEEIYKSDPSSYNIVFTLKGSSPGETFEAVGSDEVCQKLFNLDYEEFTQYKKQDALLRSVIDDEYVFYYTTDMDQTQIIDIVKPEPPVDLSMAYSSNETKKKRKLDDACPGKFAGVSNAKRKK